nr:basic proline-rich protein-like [Caretta caretta]
MAAAPPHTKEERPGSLPGGANCALHAGTRSSPPLRPQEPLGRPLTGHLATRRPPRAQAPPRQHRPGLHPPAALAGCPARRLPGAVVLKRPRPPAPRSSNYTPSSPRGRPPPAARWDSSCSGPIFGPQPAGPPSGFRAGRGLPRRAPSACPRLPTGSAGEGLCPLGTVGRRGRRRRELPGHASPSRRPRSSRGPTRRVRAPQGRSSGRTYPNSSAPPLQRRHEQHGTARRNKSRPLARDPWGGAGN